MTTEITPADREAAQKFDTALDVRLTGTRLHNLAGAFARHRITAEQRAQEAEPVAWMYSDDDDIVLHVERKPKGAYPYWTETPLYAHPPQADDDLTAGSASRNDEVRALQAEADRLREALRRCITLAEAYADGTGSLFTDAMAEFRAILAGEVKHDGAT